MPSAIDGVAISAASEDCVWHASDNEIQRYQSGGIQSFSSGGQLTDVVGVSCDVAYAVGSNGVITEIDGSATKNIASGAITTRDLTQVMKVDAGFGSKGGVLAFGAGGAILSRER